MLEEHKHSDYQKEQIVSDHLCDHAISRSNSLKEISEHGKDISSSAYLSYQFAKDTLKGRFELGEAAIAKSGVYSCKYAKEVLKGRFEAGEEVIAQSVEYAYLYALDVLNGRFELGEKAISKHPVESYLYAVNVLKGRFEAGEKQILSFEHMKFKYLNFIRKNNICSFSEIKLFAKNVELIVEYIDRCVSKNQRDAHIEELLFDPENNISEASNLFHLYFSKVSKRLHEREDFIASKPIIYKSYVWSLKERFILYEKKRYGISLGSIIQLLDLGEFNDFQITAFTPYFLCFSFLDLKMHSDLSDRKSRFLPLENSIHGFKSDGFWAYQYGWQTKQAFPQLLNEYHLAEKRKTLFDDVKEEYFKIHSNNKFTNKFE